MSSRSVKSTEWQYIDSDQFQGYYRQVQGADGLWYPETRVDPNFGYPRTQAVDVDTVTQQLSRTSIAEPSYSTSPTGGGVYTTSGDTSATAALYSTSPPSRDERKVIEPPKSLPKHHSSSSRAASSRGGPTAGSSESGKAPDNRNNKYQSKQYRQSGPVDPFYNVTGPSPSTQGFGSSSSRLPKGSQSRAPDYSYSYGYGQSTGTEGVGIEATVGAQDKAYKTTQPSLPYANPAISYATTPASSAPLYSQYGAGSSLPLATVEEDPYLTPGPYQSTNSRGRNTYAPLATGASQPLSVASSSRRGKKDFSVAGLPEEIDGRFVVEQSHKFRFGQIFKILWSEPRGQTTREDIDKMTEKAKIKPQFGKEFYVSFRRYIIAREDTGHSICVPILTYEGKACCKRGVKPEKHGIIYDYRDSPKMLQGEPDLGFDPIRMVPTSRDQSLAIESRINYSKPMTIEHNYKVFFIGYVDAEDLLEFEQSIDKAWSTSRRSRP